MKGQLRFCRVCGQIPVAMPNVDYCFACWPGGPVVPPPCLRCGSVTGYFTRGLCVRCHHGARPGVDSCLDCFAWGATRHNGWRCVGCERYRQLRAVGTCRSCGRPDMPLSGRDRGCRLCRKQRARVLAGRPWPLPDLIDANCYGQQLFFADMFWFPVTDQVRAARQVTAVSEDNEIVPVAWRQQLLFDWPWDLRAAARRGFPPPPNWQLAEALMRVADARADRYGWTQTHRLEARRGIRIVLALQQTPGAPVKGSEVKRLAQLGLSVPAVTAVLTDAGMFDDDLEPAIIAWFRSQVADLPDDMRAELTVWFDVMRHGSSIPPRRVPRKDGTTSSQLRNALPALRHWATTHNSLREVTRDEVKGALPASGSARSLTLQSFRSIFRILKARQLVFVNPTARMKARTPDHPLPQPVDLARLRMALGADRPRPGSGRRTSGVPCSPGHGPAAAPPDRPARRTPPHRPTDHPAR